MGVHLASIAGRYNDHASTFRLGVLSRLNHNHADALIVHVDAVTSSRLYVLSNSLSDR